MNVYDFDENRIYRRQRRPFFCLFRKKPGFRLVNWKYKCYNFLVNSKLMTKTKARQHQYAFLKRMENLEQTLEDYWDTQIKFMKPWYQGKARRRYHRQRNAGIFDGSDYEAAEAQEPGCNRHGPENRQNQRRSSPQAPTRSRPMSRSSSSRTWTISTVTLMSTMIFAVHAKHAFVVYGDDQIAEWNEYFKTHKKK